LAQLTREKGALLLYATCAIVIGVVVPFFSRDITIPLTMAAAITTVFLSPLLADSMAGEREKKTLESLLSTPIVGKQIVYGKFSCYLLFALCFFMSIAVLSVLTVWLAGYGLQAELWQLAAIIIIAVLHYSALALAGVYISAKSDSLRTASGKVSLMTYPLGFLFLIFITLALLLTAIPVVVVGFLLALVYFAFILVYATKTARMKQSDYFENIKARKRQGIRENHASFAAPKSQYGIVLRHELKYLSTLKSQFLIFAISCFAPAIIVCLLPYYTSGKTDLGYAVLLSALLVPRITAILIAYSIGGEKAYKTGEALLSTPLRVRPTFLAKATVPILITAAMLIASSSITLMSVDILGRFLPDAVSSYMFNAEQLILLFPVGILSSMLMVFIAGVLALTLKTPRQALHTTTLIVFVMVVPTAVILYLAPDVLIWSLVYCAILLVLNLLFIGKLSEKIERPQIVGRL
jgi:ABC-type Na+ efflux pump permease subunit